MLPSTGSSFPFCQEMATAAAGAPGGGGEAPQLPPDREPPEDWREAPGKPPKRRTSKTRHYSSAWQYFQCLGGLNKERCVRVRCKFCKEESRRGDSSQPGRGLCTSGMLAHLFRHHWLAVSPEFRAEHRVRKHKLCPTSEVTSEEEEHEEEVASPLATSVDDSADAQPSTSTAPPPAARPAASTGVIVPEVNMSGFFLTCSVCFSYVAVREDSILRVAELAAQHHCPPRQ